MNCRGGGGGFCSAEMCGIGQVLYTGPMYQIYNMILRQFPKEDYKYFSEKGNSFATTIHVLASAVVKIARVKAWKFFCITSKCDLLTDNNVHFSSELSFEWILPKSFAIMKCVEEQLGVCR
jgi:hypothetical protein